MRLREQQNKKRQHKIMKTLRSYPYASVAVVSSEDMLA